MKHQQPFIDTFTESNVAIKIIRFARKQRLNNLTFNHFKGLELIVAANDEISPLESVNEKKKKKLNRRNEKHKKDFVFLQRINRYKVAYDDSNDDEERITRCKRSHEATSDIVKAIVITIIIILDIARW